MPVNRTIANDLGSVALAQLVADVAAAEVKSAAVTSAVINDTTTGSVVFFMTDVDVVITDCLIAHTAGAAWADVDTDFFIEHDTDLAFGSATIVLDAQGFSVTNHPNALVAASDFAANAVATRLFPFLLPAGSLLRARLINNENANNFSIRMSAKYTPVDDIITLTPNLRRRVSRTVDRVF